MTRRIFKNLTVQVLVAVIIGICIGKLKPEWGKALEPLMTGFIKLIKMVVGPIVFLTIGTGIASMGDLKRVGRVGLKSLFYFEVVTTLALAIGLLVANTVRPGDGIDTSDPKLVAEIQNNQAQTQKIQAQAKEHSISQFLLNAIPESIIGAFAAGDMLQILCFSVLFGLALASLGRHGAPVIQGMEHLMRVMFSVVSIIMRVAPLGALGAMAFVVAKYGSGLLQQLAWVMVCVYLTMIIFIFGVLWLISRIFGFSLWKYLVFIREEIMLVLGTSSSETALPRMIEKLELFGCGRQVVKLVIPTGYSFNLDGTSIYLSMAVLFIAQAFKINLSFGQQIYILAILMLTSKGAAAVTGGGYITLAATLSATHVLPIEGLGLLFGIDRFMSEARAITNLIGNGVATICVSKWEGAFNQTQYLAAIHGHPLTGPVPASAEVIADVARDDSF